MEQRSNELRIDNPFSIYFSGIFWDPFNLWENGRKPFSKDWKLFWDKAIEKLPLSNSEPSYVRERYNSFKKDGFYFLKNLYERGADPNFILAVFFQYSWNRAVPNTENEAEEFKVWQRRLEAIQIVKAACGVYFSHDHPIFSELSFVGEEIARSFVNPKDVRLNTKHPPSDKENRVIFTIFEHLKHRTGRPHWKEFINLCVAAKLLRVNSFDDPHRHLEPRIRSFEKDHPKEALFIRNRAVPERRPFWTARAERLGLQVQVNSK